MYRGHAEFSTVRVRRAATVRPEANADSNLPTGDETTGLSTEGGAIANRNASDEAAYLHMGDG